MTIKTFAIAALLAAATGPAFAADISTQQGAILSDENRNFATSDLTDGAAVNQPGFETADANVTLRGLVNGGAVVFGESEFSFGALFSGSSSEHVLAVLSDENANRSRSGLTD